jgi:hypothetical protein
MVSARANSFGIGGTAVRVCVAALCVLAGALVLDASSAGAESVFGGAGTKAGQFIEPSGIAVDQENGDLYVLDSNNERVEKFTREGVFLLAWGWGVADPKIHALQTCTAVTGCSGGLSGTGAGELGFAEGLAVDNDPRSLSRHDVYVVDIDSYRVEKFSPTGRFLLMFGGGVNKTARERGETSGEDVCPVRPGDVCGPGVAGSTRGQLDFRDEGNFIAVGATGTVYVGDHNRLQEFSPNGEYESQVALVPYVQGTQEEGGTLELAVDAQGDMYVLRYGISGVQKYTTQGQLKLTINEEAPLENAETPTPAMTLDGAGDLFLDFHDGEQHHIVEYDPGGVEVASFDAGMGDGLHGLAFGDAANKLYVVNADGPVARVRIVTPPRSPGSMFWGFSVLPWLLG